MSILRAISKLTSDTPDVVGGLRGNPLPYNPKWQSTIGVEYDQPLSAKMTGHAGLSWHYTGRRYSDFDAASGQRKLRPYSQVDAHLGVDFDRFRPDDAVQAALDAVPVPR